LVRRNIRKRNITPNSRSAENATARSSAHTRLYVSLMTTQSVRFDANVCTLRKSVTSSVTHVRWVRTVRRRRAPRLTTIRIAFDNYIYWHGGTAESLFRTFSSVVFTFVRGKDGASPRRPTPRDWIEISRKRQVTSFRYYYYGPERPNSAGPPDFVSLELCAVSPSPFRIIV